MWKSCGFLKSYMYHMLCSLSIGYVLSNSLYVSEMCVSVWERESEWEWQNISELMFCTSSIGRGCSTMINVRRIFGVFAVAIFGRCVIRKIKMYGQNFTFKAVTPFCFAQTERFEKFVQINQTVLIDVHQFAHFHKLLFGIMFRQMLLQQITCLSEFIQRDKT